MNDQQMAMIIPILFPMIFRGHMSSFPCMYSTEPFDLPIIIKVICRHVQSGPLENPPLTIIVKCICLFAVSSVQERKSTRTP